MSFARIAAALYCFLLLHLILFAATAPELESPFSGH